MELHGKKELRKTIQRKVCLWGVLLFSILGGALSYYSTNLTYQRLFNNDYKNETD